MQKKTLTIVSATVTALATTILIAGCAASGANATTAISASDVLQQLKSSFSERGIAKMDRLDQTELQRVCSESAASGQPLPEAKRAAMEKAQYEAIPYPADGKYLGDWKKGEAVAQNGRGMQFSDVAGVPNGANCYACHQLTSEEISFGNQGPSLRQYGKLRGVTDPTSKVSEGIVKYTWARIWNTHAFNTCSGMPQFGDAGILTTEQIKDVMALLLDPESPVNK